MKSLVVFRSKNLKGVSYIETVLVVVIVSVIAVLFLPFGARFINNSNLSATEFTIISIFRKAQFYSIDAKNDESWGVCLIDNTIRIFTGSCESPNYNEDYTFSGSVNISGFDSSIVFSKHTGEANSENIINISSSLNYQSQIIVNEVGGINVQRL